MRRMDVLQGIRLMKFEEILGRTKRRQVSQEEAASMLGMSERTFRRWRDRFEADGAQGPLRPPPGPCVGAARAVDEVMRVLELFDTRYFDFTGRHFWDCPSSEIFGQKAA